MRTDRRQDLKTNELSHQLDAVRDYVKENATLLTVIAVIVVVVVGASLAYAKWQNDLRAEAWDTIAAAAAKDDPVKVVDELEAVAAKEITPGLTKAALLRIGETAMRENTRPAKPEDAKDSPLPAPVAKPVDWAAKARETYTQIMTRFPDDKLAAGDAIVALGVLAEDQGDAEKARAMYKRVVDDKHFLHTSLVAEAEYRLTHLDQWSKPVVFPPPQMTVPEPEGQEAEASAAPKKAPPVRPPAPAAAPAAPAPQGAQPSATPPPATPAQPTPLPATPPPATPPPPPVPGTGQ